MFYLYEEKIILNVDRNGAMNLFTPFGLGEKMHHCAYPPHAELLLELIMNRKYEKLPGEYFYAMF